jgi:hypothetical protein
VYRACFGAEFIFVCICYIFICICPGIYTLDSMSFSARAISSPVCRLSLLRGKTSLRSAD